MENNKNEQTDPRLISYLTLRKAIGIIGIVFPVVLVMGTVSCFGYSEIQNSISAYYHTPMRNVFVGLLCAIALFLFTYTGYDSTDSTAGNIGCIFALGVAFFPTSYCGHVDSCVTEPTNNEIISTIHFIAATGLFLMLAYFSICRFTKTKKGPENCLKKLSLKQKTEKPERLKLLQNRIYIGCGLTIIGCIILIGIYAILQNKLQLDWLSGLKPIFWLESIALWAFGISWLTKGKAFHPVNR